MSSLPFGIIDICFVAILVVSGILAYIRGFVREVQVEHGHVAVRRVHHAARAGLDAGDHRVVVLAAVAAVQQRQQHPDAHRQQRREGGEAGSGRAVRARHRGAHDRTSGARGSTFCGTGGPRAAPDR